MFRPRAVPVHFVLGAFLVAPSSLLAQNPTRQTPSASFGTISVADAAGKIRALIEQPAPPGMSRVDLKTYQSQTDWLKTVASRLDKVNQGTVSPRDQATGQASGKVTAPRDAQSGQASGRQVATVLSPDIDLLRKAIEQESLRFTTLSNVLKTRHDAAMNAIRNMKG